MAHLEIDIESGVHIEEENPVWGDRTDALRLGGCTPLVSTSTGLISPLDYIQGKSHKGYFWLGRVLSRRKSDVKSNDGRHAGLERTYCITYLKVVFLNLSMLRRCHRL